MRTLRGLAAVSAGILFLACGDSGGDGGGGGPTLAISPAGATVTAGGTAAFTATLTGSTDTINWSLTPAGVGSIAPTSGPNTTYTAPASVAGATSVTLTATAGSLTRSVTITVNPPATITVSGKVVAGNGQPVANAPVVITGRPSTISDANGDFTVTGVTTPYDLTAVVSSIKLAVVYKGLTRTDPTIFFFAFSPPLANSATLSGKVTGGAAVPAPPFYTKVAFGSPDATDTESATWVAPDLTYAFSPITWFGPVSTTGTLHALQWRATSSTNPPNLYSGYGQKTGVTISNGGTFANQDVPMTAVTPANLDGTVTVPTGYTLAAKAMSVNFSDGASIAILNDATATAAFNYLTPAISGSTMAVSATASTAASELTATTRTNLSASATGVGVTLQPAPVLSLPVNAATNVGYGQSFSWTAFAGGVHMVVFNGPAGQPDYFVFTGGTSTAIPDLSSEGLGLPASAAYTWGIYGIAPVASVDALAGQSQLLPSGDSAYIGLSATRTFTTAP